MLLLLPLLTASYALSAAVFGDVKETGERSYGLNVASIVFSVAGKTAMR